MFNFDIISHNDIIIQLQNFMFCSDRNVIDRNIYLILNFIWIFGIDKKSENKSIGTNYTKSISFEVFYDF